MTEWERVFAIADGRIPDGIDPESPEGRRYAALITKVQADVAAAPPMTPAQKRFVVTLLRGGGRNESAA